MSINQHGNQLAPYASIYSCQSVGPVDQFGVDELTPHSSVEKLTLSTKLAVVESGVDESSPHLLYFKILPQLRNDVSNKTFPPNRLESLTFPDCTV